MRGDWKERSPNSDQLCHACTRLAVAMPNDLFEQVYLNAWLRAEQNNEALHLLEKRVAARRYIPSIQCGLALTYNKLG